MCAGVVICLIIPIRLSGCGSHGQALPTWVKYADFRDKHPSLTAAELG